MTIRNERLRIIGMRCVGCETVIEDALTALEGVRSAKANHSGACVDVSFDDARVRLSQVLAAIEAQGYTITLSEGAPRTASPVLGGLVKTAKLLAVFLVIGGVVKWGMGMMPGLMMRMQDPQVGYSMILVVGFLTGFHCIGMCGSFVVAYSTAAAGRGKGARAVGHLAYGAGKTLSYALLGAAFGGLGALITITPFMRGVQSGIRHQPRPLVIGLLTGFLLGCGPLQAMYIMAAGTGSPREGALLLMFFSLGTLGPLLTFGFFAHLLSHRLMNELLRVSGVLVLVMGLMMTNRGLRLTESGFDTDSLRARWQVLMHDVSQHAGEHHEH